MHPAPAGTIAAMDLVLYGIPSCSTVKKAREWLDDHHVPYRFHDFKKEGLAEPILDQWIADHGVEQLINRRGTTWRALPPERRETLDGPTARALILENLSIIKRPVLEHAGGWLIGFDPDQYSRIFQKR